MEIKGLAKTTLLDYPGHVAATLFVGGCQFKCPFCHNGSLVTKAGQLPNIPLEEVYFSKNAEAFLTAYASPAVSQRVSRISGNSSMI